ncbi:MAG: hypothetical protein ACRDIB_11585, partial [Ardenticatenaceae bacterium]
EYCYRMVAVSGQGVESGSTEITCVTPKLDPIAPEGGIEINDDALSIGQLEVELNLRASDAPSDVHALDGDEPPVDEGAQISGVAEMMISNRRDFAGAVWEPYVRSKLWTLQAEGDFATIFVKFRDGAGNVSESAFDIILIDSMQPTLYLPLLQR